MLDGTLAGVTSRVVKASKFGKNGQDLRRDIVATHSAGLVLVLSPPSLPLGGPQMDTAESAVSDLLHSARRLVGRATSVPSALAVLGTVRRPRDTTPS